MQLVNSYERFVGNGIQDAFLTIGFLDGSNLRLRAASDGNCFFNKRLVISAIACPQTVSWLADELEADLVEMMVILAKQEIPARRRNVDVAEQKT